MHRLKAKAASRGIPARQTSLVPGVYRQSALFCRCGSASPARCGLCRGCYWRLRNSGRRFGGHREAVLERDGFACRVCGAAGRVVVHHRKPGKHCIRWLISLCAACHSRIHRLRAIRKWLPEALVPLWVEQHPGVAVQLQLEFARAHFVR